MTQFDEAARKAVRDINDAGRVEFDAQVFWCEKAYAEIEAVFGKLVELADATTKAANLQGTVNMCKAVGMGIDPEWVEQLREAGGVITRLISDPQVKSAIERSKG